MFGCVLFVCLLVCFVLVWLIYSIFKIKNKYKKARLSLSVVCVRPCLMCMDVSLSGVYGCLSVCVWYVWVCLRLSVSGVYGCVYVCVRCVWVCVWCACVRKMPGVKQLMGDNCIVVLTDFIVCSYFP